MVRYTMQVTIQYPDAIKPAVHEFYETIQGILKNNMNLMVESTAGKDMLPTDIHVTWINGFIEAFKDEARYQFEEGYMYEEDDPEYNIELTDEDYEEIADDVSNDDWLNEQVGSTVRDAVREHVQRKMEDSDNNE